MTGGKYNNYSAAYTKLAFRYFCLRHHYYSTGTSGFYPIQDLKLIAPQYNLKYHTLRVNLKEFQRQEWLCIHGKYFRFRTLEGEVKSWFKLFRNFYKELMEADNPAIAFCNRVIISIKTYSYLQRQAVEQSKNYDKRTARKYLRTVRGTNTPLGVNENLFFSLRSIGKELGKSHVTISRYLNRGVKDKLVRVKKNSRAICEYKDYEATRKALGVYGRTFTKMVDGKWMVFQRLQNTLFFA